MAGHFTYDIQCLTSIGLHKQNTQHSSCFHFCHDVTLSEKHLQATRQMIKIRSQLILETHLKVHIQNYSKFSSLLPPQKKKKKELAQTQMHRTSSNNILSIALEISLKSHHHQNKLK